MSLFSDLSILVVGENAYERRLMVDLLRGCSVGAVRVAPSAIHAYSEMLHAPADLLLVDADMQPHSGLRFARELRDSGLPARNAPIILFTAETSAAFADAAEQAGVDDVLLKPVTLGHLRNCLDTAVRGRRAGERLSERVAASAADLSPGVTLKRAEWELPAQRIDRAARETIVAALEEARAYLADYARDPQLETLRRLRASVAAATAGAEAADPPARRAVSALGAFLRRRDPHLRLLDAALLGARAVVSQTDRPALRQALCDAVADAARTASKARVRA